MSRSISAKVMSELLKLWPKSTAEEMNHVYPLYPIPEAKPAVNRIIQVVMR